MFFASGSVLVSVLSLVSGSFEGEQALRNITKKIALNRWVVFIIKYQ